MALLVYFEPAEGPSPVSPAPVVSEANPSSRPCSYLRGSLRLFDLSTLRLFDYAFGVRIIAGHFKSRTLKTLRGQALRPISDRLRETLFNILGAAVENSVFLDVYAGTGAVGIEALSRGARQVLFIENHRPAVALIRANLASLGIRNGFQVLAANALSGLEKLSARGLRADFIFLAPPYADRDAYSRSLALLDSLSLLAPSSLLIIEHTKKHALPERLDNLRRARLVQQGDSSLSFYRWVPRRA